MTGAWTRGEDRHRGWPPAAPAVARLRDRRPWSPSRCGARRSCGYTPSATITATSGAIAARFRPSISRDSTAGPTRLCIVPLEERGSCRRRPAPRRRWPPARRRACPRRCRTGPGSRRRSWPEPGIASVAKRDDQEQRRQHRRPERHPAQLARATRCPPARAAITPMIRNSGTTTSPWLSIWKSAPWAPLLVEGEDPQHDEAELGDRRVGDHQPHVVLREGEDRPVQDREDRHDDEQLLPVLGALGHDRQHDPQEAVDAHLRQHAATSSASTGIGVER